MLPIRIVLAPLLVTAMSNVSMSSGSSLPEEVVQKSAPKAESSGIRPATDDDIKKMKSLDERYQKAKSISMDLEKTLKLGVLNQERKSKGRLLISQGRLRMEIDRPDKSLVVVDKKNIWVVQYPPEDLKNAALQVIRASAETKKGRSQSFIGLLVKGGILKYFKVLSAQTNSDKSVTYFLQPEKGTVEFARAQVTVSENGEQLTQLKYWDELNNESTFKFTNISLNKKVADSQFTYTPPKNADVTNY